MTLIQFLAEWIVRSSILILVGTLLLWLLHVRNPSLRLSAWTVILAGSLAIPLLTEALPKVPLPLLRPPAKPSPAAALPLTREPVVTLPWNTIPDITYTRTPFQSVHAKPFDRMRLAAILYTLAAMALLLRLFSGLVLSQRLLRRSRLTGILCDGIEVRESDGVASPVTIGIRRPAVLLPPDWCDWDAAKLHAVLAHERSHIRRRDPAVQFVSAIHRALLWASPLSWFLDRSIVRTAEQISDDDAITVTRDRVSYAEILLEFVQRGAVRTNSLGVPMARYDRPEERIRRILNSSAIPRGVTRWGILAILGLGLPITYLAAAAHPQAATNRRALQIAHTAPRTEVPPPAIAPTPTGATVPTPAPMSDPSAAAVDSAKPRSPIRPEPTPKSVTTQDKPVVAERAAFEVASIKPVKPGVPHMVGVRVFPGGRITISSFSLKALVVSAFGLSHWQISCGDECAENDLYDVEATPPEALRSSIKDLRYTLFGIEDAHLREMLQSLLIDRFQLKFHRETKTGDVYLLVQSGKTLRLRPSDAPSEVADPSADLGAFGSIGYAGGQWNIFATSMPQLAKFASGFVLHAPVLDRTELSGSFDYRQRVPDLEPKYSGDQSDSFLSYLAELGLKLERSRGPVEMLVIDHASKPSPN